MHLKKYINYIVLVCCLFISWQNNANGQTVTITSGLSALQMAQKLAGPGVVISNVRYNGCDSSKQAGKFVCSSPVSLSIDSGIILSTGFASMAAGISSTPSTNTNHIGDSDLYILSAPQASFDACVLEFDFLPSGDTVRFDYVFASAEYEIFSCSIADVFGFFISGPGISGPFSNNAANMALLPNGCYVGVNTVNGQTSNPCGNASGICAPPNNALFFSNLPIGSTATGIAYNGYTLPLTAMAIVVPCSTYHLKIAISDASDHVLDSGVFLEAGSLSSLSSSLSASSIFNQPAPYFVEGCPAGGIIVKRPNASSYPLTVYYNLAGSAVNGVDYATLPGFITIPANQTTAVIPITALVDNNIEGLESIKFSQVIACDSFVTDTITVYIADSILLKILTNDTTICNGKSATIQTYADNNLNFTWSPNAFINGVTSQNPIVTPPQSTTYAVTASFVGSGCPPVHDTIRVNIDYGPLISLGQNRVKCYYDSVRILAEVSPPNNPNYTYSWQPTLGLTSIAPNEVSYAGIANSTYSCTVAGVNICPSTASVAIQVFPKNLANAFPADTSICPGNTVLLRATGAVSYHWIPGHLTSDSTASISTATTTASQIYTLHTVDINGCKDTDLVNIFVASNAILSAGPDATVYPGDVYSLYATGNCSQFSWAPSLYLSNTTVINPTVSGMTTSMQYVVSGITEYNCATTDTVILTYSPQSLINVPNAFTPGNGSSSNDKMYVQHLGTATLTHFRIFNRWGQMVFDTNNINEGWNGRYHDVPQPMGTYIFQVEAVDNTGKLFSKTGNFTLIR